MSEQNDTKNSLNAEVLDDVQLTLGELCRTCRIHADQVIELVDEGILEPKGNEVIRWRFQATCIRRIHRVQRLQSDLGVNTAGAALAIELLDEMERIRNKMERLEGVLSSYQTNPQR